MVKINDQTLLNLQQEKKELLKQLDADPKNADLKRKVECKILEIKGRLDEITTNPSSIVEVKMAKDKKEKPVKEKKEKVVKEKVVKEPRVTNKSKCIAEFDAGNFDLKAIAEKYKMPLGTARTVYQEEKSRYGHPLDPAKKEKPVKEKTEKPKKAKA